VWYDKHFRQAQATLTIQILRSLYISIMAKIVSDGKTYIRGEPLIFQEQDKRADVHNVYFPISHRQRAVATRRTTWEVGDAEQNYKFSAILVFKITDTREDHISEISLSS
jgi:hypothetical protein